MSDYTATTERMSERLKRDLENYKAEYSHVFKLSEPMNKNKEIREYLEHRMKYTFKAAEKAGFAVTYNIEEPMEQSGYNCAACRKRKKGDYFWFGADFKPRKPSKYGSSGWFHRIAKVCSNECYELMVLRLM